MVSSQFDKVVKETQHGKESISDLRVKTRPNTNSSSNDQR